MKCFLSSSATAKLHQCRNLEWSSCHKKKQICLICCTQLVSTSAETSLLWLDCPSGEDMKTLPSRTRRGENDKSLLSQKWVEKVELLAGFRPPLRWTIGSGRPANCQGTREARSPARGWRRVEKHGWHPDREVRGEGWMGGCRPGREVEGQPQPHAKCVTDIWPSPPSPFPLLSLFTIRPPHGAASPFSVQPRLLCPSFFHPFLSILGSVWCFVNKTPCWGPFVPT